MTKKEKFEIQKERDMKLFQERKIPQMYQEFALRKFEGELRGLINREKENVFCPVCGKYHPITDENRAKIKFGKIFICPCCGFQSILSTNKVAKVKYHYKWTLLLQKHGEHLLFRYFLHQIREEPLFPVQIETIEKFRTVCFEGKMKSYMLIDADSGVWGKYKKPRTYNYWQEPGIWRFPSRGLYLYPRSIYVAEKTEFYKYSAFALYAKKMMVGKPIEFDMAENYLSLYSQFPVIERLNKLGMYTLTKEILQRSYWVEGLVNKESQNNVQDFLQLDANCFLLLRNINEPSWKDVELLQLSMEYGKISENDFMTLRGMNKKRYTYEKYLGAMQNATLYRIRRYISEKCNGDDSSYFDYLSWLREMDYPKTDSHLYPKDFRKAHDKAYAAYKAFKSEEERKKKEQYDIKMHEQFEAKIKDEKYHFSDGKFCIMIPRGVKDLEDESHTLNHCVRQYAGKIAEGKTEIFFIRKKTKADKPFYTLEIASGSIVQCRTVNNGPMTEEVKLFADKFLQRVTS